MAHTPRIVGKCTELANGEECGGNLKEDIVRSGSRFLEKIGITQRSNKLVGYICDKCGSKTPLTDPMDFIRSISR